MSSHDAPAHAGNKKLVAARQKIFETIVSAVISARARLEKADLPDGRIVYLRFPHSVKGGNVFVHVRGEQPEQWKGRTIVARAELWEKSYQDGGCDRYIDLYPTSEAPRYRLCVTCGEVPKRFARGQRFPMPAPKQGLVIFGQIG